MAEQSNEVRFTVVTPSDLYERIKLETARQRRPAKNIVADCLDKCIPKIGTQQQPSPSDSGG